MSDRKWNDPPNRACRVPKTHKYTRKCIELMGQLGELWGCSNTAVVERAVREMATAQGFDIRSPAEPGSDTEL